MSPKPRQARAAVFRSECGFPRKPLTISPILSVQGSTCSDSRFIGSGASGYLGEKVAEALRVIAQEANPENHLSYSGVSVFAESDSLRSDPTIPQTLRILAAISDER